jgi:hypothetical protein
MHQKQPPAKMATADIGAESDGCCVALLDQVAIVPRERAKPAPKMIALKFIVVSPVLT